MTNQEILRILGQTDFTELYQTEWSNALCKDRKHLDVLPDYRRQGIAAALTGRLAQEIKLLANLVITSLCR